MSIELPRIGEEFASVQSVSCGAKHGPSLEQATHEGMGMASRIMAERGIAPSVDRGGMSL